MPQDHFVQLAANVIDMAWIKKHTLNFNALERTTAHNDFLKSTDYLLELMKEAGFSQIERIALPCDGVTVYDDCVMPLAWNRKGRSTFEIVSPEKRVLADSDLEPISSAVWSPPTPPEGVTAELVSLRSAVSEDWHELKGKIVLWDDSPSGALKLKLIEAGALGIAAYVDATFDTNPDDVRWMNGVGLRGWYYTKDDPQMWVFAITPRQGRELESRLAAGEKITVKAVMDTQVAPGEIYTVTGVIPGESPEEHALLAHLYEPFVADDAAGATLSIAVGKALKDLAAQGKIAPLKKSLRVVFSMERFGFSEFFCNRERSKNVISSINMDSVCHYSLKLAGVPLELRHSPASAPHFDVVLLRNMLKENYPSLTFQETPGTLSDDTFGADSVFGIPCSWLHTPPAPARHHNTGAIFNDADWEIAAAVTALVTAYHAKLNNAAAVEDGSELFLIMEVHEGIQQDAEMDFTRLADSSFAPDEKEFISDFLLSYHSARLAAFNREVPGAADPERCRQKLEEIRNRCLTTDEEAPSTIPGDHPMRSWIVTRAADAAQLMSLAKLPVRERYRKITMPSMLFLALLDGKRTLHEAYIISKFFLKGTPSLNEADQLIETLEFLEKYGYYTIVKK